MELSLKMPPPSFRQKHSSPDCWKGLSSCCPDESKNPPTLTISFNLERSQEWQPPTPCRQWEHPFFLADQPVGPDLSVKAHVCTWLKWNETHRGDQAISQLRDQEMARPVSDREQHVREELWPASWTTCHMEDAPNKAKLLYHGPHIILLAVCTSVLLQRGTFGNGNIHPAAPEVSSDYKL